MFPHSITTFGTVVRFRPARSSRYEIPLVPPYLLTACRYCPVASEQPPSEPLGGGNHPVVWTVRDRLESCEAATPEGPQSSWISIATAPWAPTPGVRHATNSFAAAPTSGRSRSPNCDRPSPDPSRALQRRRVRVGDRSRRAAARARKQERWAFPRGTGVCSGIQSRTHRRRIWPPTSSRAFEAPWQPLEKP